MIMHDFHCDQCNLDFEDLVQSDEKKTPCVCGATADRVMSAPKMFQEIVPTTLTSKKLKAGYVHHFNNKPAEKISVSVPRAIE
ncbi:MAG: hypothetical protein H0U59_12855 [Gemmatimonadaceae bacterium]|nr:hypothetical protein [Gemmatimonadaceae bacterium]